MSPNVLQVQHLQLFLSSIPQYEDWIHYLTSVEACPEIDMTECHCKISEM